MFNWKKWQKLLVSLIMLASLAMLVGNRYVSGTDFKDLHTGEEVVDKEEEKPVNEVLVKHRQSEGYDLISAEYREQKEFERLEEIRIEEERIAKEKAEEEARLAEEARIKAEEEARIAQEQEEVRLAEEARLAEQQASATTSQQTQQAPQQQQQATQQQQRTDGFNFHGYNFSIRTFEGSGHVPKETPHVYSWDCLPSHYLVEQVSPAGRVIQQLGMGDTVVVNGVSYVVTHIKRKVPNDENGYDVVTSMGADITIQTCEKTKGANGKYDLTIWYLTRQ